MSWPDKDGTVVKVRKDIRTECGPLKGASYENKVLIATAMAVAWNDDLLKKHNGLVLRRFIRGTPFATPDTWIIGSAGIGTRVKNTTGWVVYASPEGKYYAVLDKYLGNELPSDKSQLIQECIEEIRYKWWPQTGSD
jgi:hypothetical protein